MADTKKRTAGNNHKVALSDRVTSMSGSWAFILFHGAALTLWVVFKFSVDVLTLILSVEAIILASLILMSQRRTQERDVRRDQRDLETDVRAEREIRDLQKTLARIESQLKKK